VIAGLIFLQAALSIAVSGPATNPEYLPVRVAAAEGYFTEEKLTVTLETLRAEPLAAQALGRRACAAATSLDCAFARPRGQRIAATRLRSDRGAARRARARGEEELIKALADLGGKTIRVSAPGARRALAPSLLAGEGIGVHQVTAQSRRRADRALGRRDRGGHGGTPGRRDSSQ
jgi:ABC-type nitrate/sulfonate/bicarbonate transport system substrate-binding protein